MIDQARQQIDQQIDHLTWQQGYDEGKRWCAEQIARKRFRRVVNGCAEYEHIAQFSDGFYASIRDFLTDTLTARYIEQVVTKTTIDKEGDHHD